MSIEVDYFENATDLAMQQAYVTNGSASVVARGASWTNFNGGGNYYGTLTSSSGNVTSAITANNGMAYNDFGASLIVGARYTISYNLTVNSGQAPLLYTTPVGGNSQGVKHDFNQLTAGAQIINFTAVADENYFLLYSSEAANYSITFSLTLISLQSYSEATIKTQGSYALKAVAAITDSLNKTLTHIFNPQSNADILNEDNTDITDWADGDGGTGDSSQVTIDDKSCMKLDSGGTAGSGNYAYRYKDIGSFGARAVVSLNIYCQAIGAIANTDELRLLVHNGTIGLYVQFCSDGLFIHTTAGGSVEVGTNLVNIQTWQEWTFDINFTAKTVDVYLDGILQASGVSCNYTAAAGNGLIRLYQTGTTTTNRISYIDWVKVGSTLTCGEPIDLSGINTLKLDMRSTRTGANVKLGLHDTGGTTTEITPTINSADTYETKTWDLSGVADADKNAIDTFVITPTNADEANTIYFDNFIGITIYSSIGDLSINLTPTSIINKIFSILGNLSIVLTPNSLYELIQQVFEIIGNLNINLIPNSIVSGNYSRDGNLNINLLPTSRINKSLIIPSNLLVEFIVHSIINKSVIKTGNLQINLVPNANYIRSYDRNGNLIIELIPNATGNINYGRLGDLLINLSPEAMVKFKHTTLRNNDFFLFFS